MAKSAIREYIEALVIAVVLALFIITFIAQSFLVQGSSMEPSLHDGQRLMVDKLTYRFVEPKRGEVVVFRYPANRRRKFIKRIVGLPGDEILIRSGYLYINGQRIEEPFVNGPTYGPYSTPAFGPVVVPEDSFFVLGDNRRNSDDSRYPDVGFVHRTDIVGLARFVYWPITQIQSLRLPAGYPQ
jgi:signal peptidase I